MAITALASVPEGLRPSTTLEPPAIRQRPGRELRRSAATASPSTSPLRSAPKGCALSGESSCIAPKPATVKRLPSSAPITSASSASPLRIRSQPASTALIAEVQAVETVNTGPCQSSAPATSPAKSWRSPPRRRSCTSCFHVADVQRRRCNEERARAPRSFASLCGHATHGALQPFYPAALLRRQRVDGPLHAFRDGHACGLYAAARKCSHGK